MSDNNNVRVRSGGVSFASLLAILFIGLKLCNQIDWSWWWVLSPLWIPFAIAAILLTFAGILWIIATCLGHKPEIKTRNRYRGL